MEQANIWLLSSPLFFFCRDEFLWAYSVLSSRSFPYSLIDPDYDGPSEVLFPLLDTLNHKPHTHITWMRNGDPETGALSFVTGNEIQAGEQIFNNYGPKVCGLLIIYVLPKTVRRGKTQIPII